MLRAKHILLCCIFSGCLYAAVWHIEDLINCSSDGQIPDKHNPLSCIVNPAVFPDTLCFVSGWSPCFSGFGVQEGLIYVGLPRISFTFITQYHRLMSNHAVTVAFPVLQENHIHAGLQIHYGISIIPDIETVHSGSCSGGILVFPHPQCTISLLTRYGMTFPQDKTYRLFEPLTSVSVAYFPYSTLTMVGGLQKREYLPWQGFAGLVYRPWDVFQVSALYEISSGQLKMNLQLALGRWSTNECVNIHPYLGMSQGIFIGYAY